MNHSAFTLMILLALIGFGVLLASAHPGFSEGQPAAPGTAGPPAAPGTAGPPAASTQGRANHRSFSPAPDELRTGDVLISTWSVSAERTSYMMRRMRSFLIFVGGLLLLASGFTGFQTYSSFPSGTTAGTVHIFGVFLVVAGAIASLYSTTPYLAARSGYRQRVSATASAKVDDAIKKACKPDKAHPPLGLAALFEFNRRQLDEYQLMTRKQQRSAYLLAQGSSLISLAALIAGVIIALAAPKPLDKSLGAGLSGLGSTLSAFLAATFFKQRKSANEEMERYYLEPQRTGRLLAAERIITLLKPSASLAAVIAAASEAAAPAPASPTPASPAPTGPARVAASPDVSGGQGIPPYISLIDGMVEKVLSWEMPAKTNPPAKVGQSANGSKAPKTTKAG